jgi:DNA-binding transcriptional LysR family regulator
MNLRKLSHFLAVVETRSLRAAAESVHLSQPALSRSLKSLEDELGIPLLDRAYGRITPTAYSTPVLEHIRKLASEGRALREAVRRLKGLEEGEIRVGFGPFAAAVALRQVGADLVSRYPKLALHIELTNSPLLIELLQQDRLDLVVCDSRYLVEGEDDMTVIPLGKQKVAFVAGRQNPLHARKGRYRLEDLKGHPIGAPTLPAELLAAFREHGFEDVPNVACDEIRVLVELAASTPLVIMVPQLVVDRLGQDHDVAALPVSIPFDPYAYPCIIHARGRTLGPATSLLIKLVQERLSQAPLTGNAAATRLKNGAGTAVAKRPGP